MTRWTRPLFALLGLVSAAAPALGGGVDFPRYPSISPDGKQVVFSWRGDLWKVGAEGGAAVRMTSNPADDLRSAWSPDGRTIAFQSTRSGRSAIHAMDADGGNIRQLTGVDGTLYLDGFNADGTRVLVSGGIEGDVYRARRPYWVSIEGGPVTRLHGAFGQSGDAHADGQRFLFERGGSGWERRHYRGPDDRDVFVYNSQDNSFQRLTDWEGNDGQAQWRDDDTVIYMSDRAGETVRLWTMDLGDGEDGAVQLTDNSDRDIAGFDVSADGRAVVFSKWDGLYTARFKGRRLGDVRRLDIQAPDDAFPKRTIKNVSAEVSEAAISPDGKVMAYVSFGDVFVRAVEDDSPTRRVTEGMARERDIAWSPDMSRLYFVSDREGEDSIYAATVTLTRGEVKERFEELTADPEEAEESAEAEQDPEEKAEVDAEAADAESDEAAEPEAEEEGEKPESKKDEEAAKEDKPDLAARWADALRFEVEPILMTETSDRRPSPSPDGTKLAFQRTRGDLVIYDLKTKAETTMLEAWDFGMDFRWSPTGEHIAWSVDNENFNSDVYIAPADGSWEPVNISRHPDNDYAPRWSQDGNILAFVSDRSDDFDVYLVMLDRRLEGASSREREAYFEEREKATKKLGVIAPIDWTFPEPDEAEEDKAEVKKPDPAWTPEDLEDAYRRLRRVTSYPGSEFGLEITPAGDRLIFTSSVGSTGSSGVYSIKWDRSDAKRLTANSSVQGVSRDGSKLVLLRSGKAYTVKPSGGSEEQVGLDASTEIDHIALSQQMFGEFVRTMGRTFYHPEMKGLDWSRLGEEYAELASKAYTASEFGDVGRRLLGELNASHLGIYPSADYSNPDYQAAGRLGIDATPVEGGFRVDHVLPRSSTNAGDMRLEPGDVITAIELEPIEPGDTLDTLLAGRAGEETIVTVRRTLDDAREVSLDLLVLPVSTGAESILRYDDWQLRNAAKVSEWSNGRLGYLHIRSMGGEDLNEYERDLYAAAYEKDGLLIDVRSNGGGWTTDRVLASLMYPEHAYTIPRGADPVKGRGYPRDRLYIQRYNGPVNMLCNEKSFSNAEIISHAFKTLGRGTLVGEETYGGVISTGAFSLVDGTRVRQPFRGWYLLDGTDMENHGAMPDIRIEQTPQDEADDFDHQLKAAVDDLLSRLD